jgi:hypothetical protein
MGVRGGYSRDFNKRDVSTVLAATIPTLPHALKATMTTAPGSASAAVTAAIIGINVHTGAACSGHNLGGLFIVDNQSANLVAAMYACEGRMHMTSGSATQTACFIAAAQTASEGAAGAITGHIDYLSPAFSDHAYMVAKYSWVNQDANKGSLTEGYLNVKGQLQQHGHNVEGATCWVNYDSTSGTPVNNGSFNVSGFVDNAAGNTTVTYTNAAAAGYKSVVASCDLGFCLIDNTNNTANFKIYSYALATLLLTDMLVCATVHGGTQ